MRCNAQKRGYRDLNHKNLSRSYTETAEQGVSLMKKIVLAASIAATTMLAAPASAVPIQWTVGSGGNGHYYDYVSNSNVPWTTAQAAATTASPLPGFESYLATITSAAENSFVAALSNGARGWIGASDDGSEGNFTWRTGPETGQAVTFTNWAGGEPNNVGDGENYVQLNLQGLGTWNDLGSQAGFNDGYFVEYSAISGAPEPATWGMMILGFGFAGTALRRRRRNSVRVTFA